MIFLLVILHLNWRALVFSTLIASGNENYLLKISNSSTTTFLKKKIPYDDDQMLYNTIAAYDWSFLYNETLYVVTLAADTDLQNGCIREPNFPFVSP